MAAAPFGFHLWIQCADVVLPGLKNVVVDFCPAPPPLKPSGTVAAMMVADPVDFKAIAAEQNRCVEMQHLLGGSSLKIAFWQAGAQWLVGNVTTGVFRPIVKTFFLILHNISHPGRLTARHLVSSRFV
jgi:hypothetical protein